MKHTISVLVENHAGVLSRISGLFSRRGFNIDSLAVGVTDDPTVSRITIVVNGNEYIVEQVKKQLNKLIDVLKVKIIEPEVLISRELMLIKVTANANTRGEIIDIVKVIGARIVDISRNSLTVEITDSADQLELLQDLLGPYGILEVARTGTIALEKGVHSIHNK